MKLTTIIICHKLERYVDMAVASVLNQTRRPDRVIVLITDCRQESFDAVMHWNDKKDRVDVIASSKPLTCAQSKNYGASLVKTDCFNTLDADDWLHPHFTQKLMFLMENGSDVVAGCDYRVIEPDGFTGDANANDTDMADIVKRNPLPSCSIVRTDAFRAMDGYDESYIWEDWQLWLKLWYSGMAMCRYPWPLFFYRRHNLAKSATDNSLQAHAQIQAMIQAHASFAQ